MFKHLSLAPTRSTEHTSTSTAPDDEVVADLTRLLTRALRMIGEGGDPEAASRLAAQAWVVVRGGHRAAAERLAGVLHYLSGLHSDESANDSTKEKRMSLTDQLLDVRAEAPARRHDLIFETYSGLGPGRAFVLVNDHDPKPLYYQFAAEHDGEFSWDYLEQGPEVWRVRIGRPEARA